MLWLFFALNLMYPEVEAHPVSEPFNRLNMVEWPNHTSYDVTKDHEQYRYRKLQR